MENFQSQYNDLYNKNRNDTTEDEQNNGDGKNLILRSFTDDPEIPLRQIKVNYLQTCENTVHYILSKTGKRFQSTPVQNQTSVNS